MSTTTLKGLVKGLDKRLITSLKSLAKGRTEVHKVACASVFHAAEHGDPIYIQKLYDGLLDNDQRQFKVWIGHTFPNVKDWLIFTKDKGFTVKPHTENVRIGSITDDVLAMPTMFEKVASSANVWEVGKAFDSMIRAAKQIVKHHENGDDVTSEELAFATGFMAQVEAASAQSRVSRIKAANKAANDDDDEAAETEQVAAAA